MNNTITRGDSFPLSVSWYIPSADNPYTDHDANLSDATVRVVRQRDGKIIIDGEVPMIDGNDTLYNVPPEALQIDSEYSAFITVEFNDGSIQTRRVDFTVTARR